MLVVTGNTSDADVSGVAVGSRLPGVTSVTIAIKLRVAVLNTLTPAIDGKLEPSGDGSHVVVSECVQHPHSKIWALIRSWYGCAVGGRQNYKLSS